MEAAILIAILINIAVNSYGLYVLLQKHGEVCPQEPVKLQPIDAVIPAPPQKGLILDSNYAVCSNCGFTVARYQILPEGTFCANCGPK